MKLPSHFMKSVSSYKKKIVREGEANRERIFEFISEKGPVSVDEIYRYLKSIGHRLSKHTIHIHLGEMLGEKRILRNVTERTYAASDLDLVYIAMFAKMMKDALGYMISPHLIDPAGSKYEFFLPSIATDFKDERIYGDFCKIVSGASVSHKLMHKTKNISNPPEQYFFEFVNRIGAYITYLFIKSIRPIKMNMTESDDELNIVRRSHLSRRLIGTAVDIQRMFEIFHGLLYSIGLINRSYPNKPIFFEVGQEEYDRLSTTFRRVYPGIWDGLENYWKQMNDWWLINTLESKENWLQRRIECNHNWKQVHIFNLEGIYYHCRKCSNVIDEYELNRIRKRPFKTI